MSQRTQQKTPLYGRLLVRLAKPFPNFDFYFIKPIRRRAIESMLLTIGCKVLDVGCGPGGSFPFLVDAVGPAGKVVGIEISPLHAEMANDRIRANDWTNVEVVNESAKDAELNDRFDGLLMFAAPDVYGSPAELANLIPHLTDDARFAAFGAKLASVGFGRMLNPIIKTLYKLSFDTTPAPSIEPWQPLTADFEILEIHEYFFGLMFLVTGKRSIWPTPVPSHDAATSGTSMSRSIRSD
jgi:SAM-dependent methyltransferase